MTTYPIRSTSRSGKAPPTEIRDLQQITPSQLREGDRFTTVLQFLGRRYETPTEVSAYEPNRRLSYRGTEGPVPTQMTFIFEEVPGGTRFTHSQEVEPRGYFGLADSVFEIEARRQLRGRANRRVANVSTGSETAV